MAKFDYSSLKNRARQSAAPAEPHNVVLENSNIKKFKNLSNHDFSSEGKPDSVKPLKSDLAGNFAYLAVNKGLITKDLVEKALSGIKGDPELLFNLNVILEKVGSFTLFAGLGSRLCFGTQDFTKLKPAIARLAIEDDPWVIERANAILFGSECEKYSLHRCADHRLLEQTEDVLAMLPQVNQYLDSPKNLSAYRFAELTVALRFSKEPAHDIRLISDTGGVPYGVKALELEQYYASGHKYLYHRYCIKGECYHKESPIPQQEKDLLERLSKSENYPPPHLQEELVKDLLTLPLTTRSLIPVLISEFYEHGFDFGHLATFIENVRLAATDERLQLLACSVGSYYGEELLLAMGTFGDVIREDKENVQIHLEHFKNNRLQLSAQSIYSQRMQRHQEKFPEKPIDIVRRDFLKKEYEDSEVVPERVLDRALDLYHNIAVRGKDLIQKGHAELVSSVQHLIARGSEGLDDKFKVEYFAHVRELIKREFGVYPYNTQMIAAILMLDDDYMSALGAKGIYAQIKTGEGKSLFTILVAGYRAALGKNIDILTSNSYLATRDELRFGDFFRKLGITCGSHIHGKDLSSHEDTPRILYSTVQDMTFTYLSRRLNGASFFRDERFSEALVDESDNLAIDQTSSSCRIATEVAPPFSKETLTQMLEFARSHGKDAIKNDIALAVASFRETNEEASAATPLMVSLYLQSACSADRVKNNEDYILTDEEKVIIIDIENTGRLLDKTQWGHGLHAFVALKHDLPIPNSTAPSAHMGSSRYLQKYSRLFCISGTIGDDADRSELKEVYGLYGFDVPPHMESRGQDGPATIVKTQEAWLTGLTRWADELTHGSAPRPLLFMTNSVADALTIANHLRANGYRPQLLTDSINSDPDGNPLDEQGVIDNAGTEGVITVATSVGGRGTDIILTEKAKTAGGIHVCWANIPSHRRVERQGRGRGARQGQPGSSEIFACFESDRWINQLPDSAKDSLEFVLDTFGPASTELQQTLDFIRRGINLCRSLNRRILLDRESAAEEALSIFANKKREISLTLEATNKIFNQHKHGELANYVTSLFLNETWAKEFESFDLEVQFNGELVCSTGSAQPQELQSLYDLQRAFRISYESEASDQLANHSPYAVVQLTLLRSFAAQAAYLESAKFQLNKDRILTMLQDLDKKVASMTQDCFKTFKSATESDIVGFIKKAQKKNEGDL